MTIESIEIAVNVNAPTNANAINLYSSFGSEELTLGQLMISVCMRAASAYEAQSVLKMNSMTLGSVLLDEASSWLSGVADGTADWASAKAFATNRLRVDPNSLPSNINSYDNRMKAVAAMKAKMDALTQQQQESMIALQTLVNRRDVAFSTSSNVVKALGSSTASGAANF